MKTGIAVLRNKTILGTGNTMLEAIKNAGLNKENMDKYDFARLEYLEAALNLKEKV